MPPDPFRVLAEAYRSGDERLSGLIVERLFPWARVSARGARSAPVGARRAVLALYRHLGL